jgi:hypothetical protein
MSCRWTCQKTAVTVFNALRVPNNPSYFPVSLPSAINFEPVTASHENFEPVTAFHENS